MKKKRHIFLTLWLATAGAIGIATAQTADYAAFLREVAARSPQLAAAEKEHTASVRQLRTGLAPDDPSVALEYYFVGETRYELAFEQAFDFPTVYHQRNKISKLGISKAEQEHRTAQRAVMGEVSDAYLRLVYATERIEIFSRRRDALRQAVELYRKGIENGSTTLIELRNAGMLLTEAADNLAVAEAEHAEAALALAQLNGGTTIAAQGYPTFAFSGTRDEFVQAALAADYELEAAAIDTLIARRTLKLSRQAWLPKLTVGYKVEIEGHKGTNALLAGISLPLWQNIGSTRAAKAARDAAEARHEAVATQAEARLKALYERFRILSSTLATRQTAHASDNYPQLIEKAIKGGELTAIDALLALSEWYALSDNLTTLKYEVAQAGAAMALCLL